jgi:hypothetical protein
LESKLTAKKVKAEEVTKANKQRRKKKEEKMKMKKNAGRRFCDGYRISMTAAYDGSVMTAPFKNVSMQPRKPPLNAKGNPTDSSPNAP